jgi:hypothetical protein
MAIRRRLAHPRFGADHGFRWRGGKISRLEGLSDAVFAFAVCFGILFWVWYEHYRFFRRYGLADGITTALTGVLLFIVLFYVYPMKFLFTMLFNQFFGEAPADVIRPSQAPELMLIYGAGFIAVQLVFVLLYLRLPPGRRPRARRPRAPGHPLRGPGVRPQRPRRAGLDRHRHHRRPRRVLLVGHGLHADLAC